MDPKLAVRGLTKRFGATTALYEADLTLAAGEVRALCGGNGAGKSTLVKILTGVLQPTAGVISIDGVPVRLPNPVAAQRAGLALVAQELSLAPDLSVVDNLWLGHAAAPFRRRTAEAYAKGRAALAEVGLERLDLDAPVRGLGLGERQLLEIARGLVRDARILILDEPTATLSDHEIALVFAAVRRLKRRGRSVILITHRLGEVFELCDTLTVMRNGAVVASGDVAGVSRDQLIEWMLGRRLDEVYPAGGAAGDVVLDVAGLGIPGVVADVALTCRAGEIVGVVGQLGSGAIEVVRALAGLEHAATGVVLVRGRQVRLGSVARGVAAGIQFVSEDRAEEGVFLRLDAGTNLTATRIADHAALGVVGGRGLRAVARRLAAGVSFDPTRLASRVDELSGGNQQKLAVGRCAERQGCVLLLNEPTRGVDMGARADIYRLLRTFCAAGFGIVLASTDMEEVHGMADRIVTMFRGRVVRIHARGAFDEAAILADITHPAAA